MNILFIALLGVLIFLLGFLVSKLFSKKTGNSIGVETRSMPKVHAALIHSYKNGNWLPRWTNRDLDSTIVAIGMLIIFGGFVEEANIGDKDVFTRLVELFNGVWLLILGFLFGKMSNSDNGEKENGTPQGTDHQRSGDTV